MKQIQKKCFEKLKKDRNFLYIQVNEDIFESVREGSSTGEDGEKDSEKRAVREGRKQVLNTFRDLNNELITDIDGSNAVENTFFNGNAIERLENNTRDSVRDILLDARPGARRLTQQFGISRYYRRFVHDVFNQAENTEHTIGDVDFSLSALDYTQNAFQKRIELEKQRDRDYRSWKKFFRNDRKKGADIFNTRSKVVVDVFTDIKERLDKRKNDMESQLDDHATRVMQEFDAMTPDEKAEFLEEVQDEIDSGVPPISTLNAIYINGIMENLNVHQRIEVYKKAKLDQGATNRNMESMADGDDHIKVGYVTSRQALETYTGTLNLNTIRNNLGLAHADINGEDLIGNTAFMEELKGYLDRHGSINHNQQYFNNYSDDFDLGNYENFIAYCKILQDNTGSLCNTIPASFKKKILACLKWVEEQEEVNEEDIDGFSSEFVNLDRDLYTELTTFNALVTSLNDVENLQLALAVLDDINTRTASIVNQVAIFEDIKQKNKLSDEELRFLENKYTNLKKLGSEVLPSLRKKYEDELKKYNDFEAEFNRYTGLNRTYTNELDRIGGKTRPNEDVTILESTGYTQHGQTTSQSRVVNNQSQLANWDRANNKVIQTQEKLAEICSKVGVSATKSPNLGSFRFNFGHIDVNTVNADIRVITDDRIERGRNLRNNPNTPNDLFKNYLLREAAKDQNKKLDELLEQNRQKSLDYLKKKKIGSSVNISCIPYQHGNPPTSTDVLNNTNLRMLDRCIVLNNTEKGSGTVLYNTTTDQIVIVQKGKESGKVEVIVLPKPSNTDILNEGLPEGFDIGATQDYVATPTRIITS